jgi:hypothetical protein
MVFNPGYLDLSSFDGYAEIPGLGISGTLVLWSLALHTVWSICVPIALVEAFDPTPTRPWLRWPGLVVTGCVFVAGCVFLAVTQARDLSFVGSLWQFAVSAMAIVGLVVAALRVGRGSGPRWTRAPEQLEGGSSPTRPWRGGVRGPWGRAPHPVVVGLAAFLVTSGYWLSTSLPLDGVWGVLAEVGCFAVAAGGSAYVVGRWSRSPGWDGRHRLALAAGAAATYATWFGPVQAGEAGTGPAETAWGALVFGTALTLVVLTASLRQHRLRGIVPDVSVA